MFFLCVEALSIFHLGKDNNTFYSISLYLKANESTSAQEIEGDIKSASIVAALGALL